NSSLGMICLEPKEGIFSGDITGKHVVKRTRSNLGNSGFKKQSRVEEAPKIVEEVEVILDSIENKEGSPTHYDSSKDKDATKGESNDEMESEKSLENSEGKCSKNSEEAIESLHALKTTQKELFTAQDSTVKSHAF
ncbi:hypothetical protein KI387_003325, partial [Taxus chinensis]